jgi:hypothetical protein
VRSTDLDGAAVQLDFSFFLRQSDGQSHVTKPVLREISMPLV